MAKTPSDRTMGVAVVFAGATNFSSLVSGRLSGMQDPQRNPLTRSVKLAISSVYFCISSAWKSLRQLLGADIAPSCVILYYHAVAQEQRLRFARQMDELLRSSKPVAANCHEPLQAGIHYAGVTFDDGVHSVIENAVPELIKRGIPATIFVVADCVGAIPTWELFGGEFDPDDRTVTVAQIEMLPTDLITIGSHTLSHPWLPSLPESEANEEIFASRKKLSSLLKRDITLFSFPYGAKNDRLVRVCRDAGYKRVFTITPTLSFKEPGEFETGRVAVDPADWSIEFRLKLIGAYRWLPAIYRLKRKILNGKLPNN